MKHLPTFAPMLDELAHFYSTIDPEYDKLGTMLNTMWDGRENKTALSLKLEQMHILAEESTVHVFRHYPFWFQFSAGRGRFIWGGLGCLGQFLHDHLGAPYLQAYYTEMEKDRQAGLIHNWNNPVGLDHHALGYDVLLTEGLSGLRQKAVDGLTHADTETEPFYRAAIEALDILAGLSERFADRAAEMLTDETDPDVRENLTWIADAARRVPLAPPKTFREALATIVFCRECIGTLEGIGISTYGHLDRMLFPYYQADLAAGRITEDEAKRLLADLLYYTAVRFDEDNGYHETSTTIILGGCDREGQVVYNDVTRLLLDVEKEIRVVSVKFDCRISSAHPEAYLRQLCGIQLAGLPVLVFMNDEIHIAARVKHGQAIEDARCYVAGGCHEIVLGGTEVCTRADTWIGLPALLLRTLRKQTWDSYDSFYQAAIADVRAYHERVAECKNAAERHWSAFGPMPLYSTTMADCLENGRDVTAGGARYSSTALSMLGAATFVDSLYALKTLLWDEGKYNQVEMCALLEKDYADGEELRQYILNRIPHFGSGDTELDSFGAAVLHDLSTVSGQTNGRGGKYYPAFYPHDIFRALGFRTGATPDGRKAGWALSRGASASEIVTGITPTDMLRSVAKIDFTEFTDSFALEITLPKLPDNEDSMAVLLGIVYGFLDAKGSTLQLNLLDPDMLIEAQKHPDEHRDLLVRVCGYSASFVTLNKETQDEIVRRELR